MLVSAVFAALHLIVNFSEKSERTKSVAEFYMLKICRKFVKFILETCANFINF